MAAKKSTSPASTKGTHIKKKQALDAYVEKGTVTAACKKAQIGRQTWYNWIEDDEDFAKAAKDAYEQVTDDIEQTSIEKGRDGGDTTMCIFLMKNRRHEVYGEKQHVTGDFSIDIGNPKEKLALGISAIAKRRGKSRGDSDTNG